MQTKELLRQIQKQDSEPAFRALFDRHYARMFRIAYFFLQDDELAKEATLDVLAEIWIKRKTMIIPNDFRHYSFVMVRNASINVWKREHQADKVSIEDTSIQDVFATDYDSELFETYERLLSELPPRCREVFCRIKEDEESYSENVGLRASLFATQGKSYPALEPRLSVSQRKRFFYFNNPSR